MLQKRMFKRYQSPNFNDRIGYDAPSMLILHYTGMQSAKGALEHLCKSESQVSAHYLIEEKGKTHNLVPEEKRAWHAGVSYWKGETDINSAAIGIEITNPGHEFGYVEFSDKQMMAVQNLCEKLIKMYKIPLSRVLGHSDVAPGRKIDPGHLFPWERLAESGIGLWPKPQEMDYQAAEDLILNKDAFHELLCAYGYSSEAEFSDIVVEYHRHFYPEKFKTCDDRPDEPDILSGAKLLALIRQSHELS